MVSANSVNKLEHLFLYKLNKNFDESPEHPEYNIRLVSLSEKLTEFFELVKDRKEFLRENIAIIILLYYELRSTGPWNTDICLNYSEKLNALFQLHFVKPISKVFETKDTEMNQQEIFDTCLQKLHEKLTVAEFKKYPSLVEVYSEIVRNIKNYNILVNPPTVLPLSLILIDDYIPSNKIIGLKCCKCILECLQPKDFVDGNYYEVIYVCLKKIFVDKDVNITESLLDCLKEFLRILPEDVKSTKTDEIYTGILDQLYSESNLYRKAAMFRFTQHLMILHKVNSARRKKLFITIICDSIDLCCNEGVEELLLCIILECLEEWIKYCWCVWQLSTDQKILSTLFKCLYSSKDAANIEKITNTLVTMINLCGENERIEIVKNLEDCKLDSKFLERINLLRKYISI